MSLFKNFVRSYSRNRQMMILNLVGLICGLTCCLLIMLWVHTEYQTDRMYPDADRIVTVAGFHKGQNPFRGAPPVVAPTLAAEFPEVEGYARSCWAANGQRCNGQAYQITTVDVDDAFFELFGCDFIAGKSFTKGENQQCVISRQAADELFGTNEALGQFLEYDFGKFAIVGVIDEMPVNTTVFEKGSVVYLPIARNGDDLQGWYNNSYESYLKLKATADVTEFDQKIRNRAYEARPDYDLYLKAGRLTDRKLYVYNHIKNIRIMVLIAVVVLLIACINFINLTTAAFTKSSFQTGLRKILGASRKELVLNNLLQTLLQTTFAFGMAYGLALLLLPYFNGMIGGSLRIADFMNGSIIWIGATIVITTTVLAGLYPAIYISSFKPISALRSDRNVKGWNARVRQGLVVLQFCISIILIISTLIISKQIKMYHKMDLGYVYDEVLYVSFYNQEQSKKADYLKQELLRNGNIRSISLSTSLPSNIRMNGVGLEWEGKDPNLNPLVSFEYVDADWLDVFGIRLKEGRMFSDSLPGVLVNDRLFDLIGDPDLIGKRLSLYNRDYRIVGVTDPVLFNDYKRSSEPLLIIPKQDIPPRILSIRTSGNVRDIYEEVYRTAETVFGEKPIVRYLDDNVNAWLFGENQTSKMVTFFSILAIIISCLGLFGLATFMTEQKRKEIAVRRVNGAEIKDIVWILNMQFLKPVAIAFVLAVPVAICLLNSWLSGYTHRTELNLWVFLLSGGITILIASLTLFWRTWAAANENPVIALKE